MCPGEVLPAAERCSLLRRDLVLLRWAAAAVIGSVTGFPVVLVLDVWSAAAVGFIAAAGAVWWDRRRGWLPELWPGDSGLYRLAVTMRNLERRGWAVYPTRTGCVLAGTGGVFVVEHLIRSPASADAEARPFTGQSHTAWRSCAETRRAASRLADNLTTNCGELPVHALVTVNASPANEPRKVHGAWVVPASRLREVVQHSPGSLSPSEVRLVTDSLNRLLQGTS